MQRSQGSVVESRSEDLVTGALCHPWRQGLGEPWAQDLGTWRCEVPQDSLTSQEGGWFDLVMALT